MSFSVVQSEWREEGRRYLRVGEEGECSCNDDQCASKVVEFVRAVELWSVQRLALEVVGVGGSVVVEDD